MPRTRRTPKPPPPPPPRPARREPTQEEKAALDQQLLAYWLTIDGEGNFIHPPETDDELHDFVEIAYGFTIPRKVVEPGHSAPFDFIADMFFERTRNALAFANRSGGKTLSVAILNHLDMLFKPGCEIASAGAVKAQAKKAFLYFKGFCQLPWFKKFARDYKRVTGRKFYMKETQEESVFSNGSRQEILTATEKGLRSPHPNKARLDEVDEIDWKLLQTGLSMAHSANGIQAQNCFTSTRQYARGSMQRLLDESEQKGIKVYEWNIWEAVEKCERRCFDDPVHGSCPIFSHCQGKAHHSDGFYIIDDFIDKVRVIDRETFETEWENKRPARTKLVYNMFDNARHVMTPERLYTMFGVGSPSAYWRVGSGIDFGGGPDNPFVYVKICQLPNGAWMIFHEYVAFQRLMRDHAIAIKSSPFWRRSEEIWSDHARQDRMELKELGIITRAANKEVRMGIDFVKSLLRGFPPKNEPMLYVWYTCSYAVKEFGLYRWPTRSDGKPDKTAMPVKENDHLLDAARYKLFSTKKRPRRQYRARTLRGV